MGPCHLQATIKLLSETYKCQYTYPENIIHWKPFGGLFKENLCSADSPKESAIVFVYDQLEEFGGEP